MLTIFLDLFPFFSCGLYIYFFNYEVEGESKKGKERQFYSMNTKIIILNGIFFVIFHIWFNHRWAINISPIAKSVSISKTNRVTVLNSFYVSERCFLFDIVFVVVIVVVFHLYLVVFLFHLSHSPETASYFKQMFSYRVRRFDSIHVRMTQYLFRQK